MDTVSELTCHGSFAALCLTALIAGSAGAQDTSSTGPPSPCAGVHALPSLLKVPVPNEAGPLQGCVHVTAFGMPVVAVRFAITDSGTTPLCNGTIQKGAIQGTVPVERSGTFSVTFNGSLKLGQQICVAEGAKNLAVTAPPAATAPGAAATTSAATTPAADSWGDPATVTVQPALQQNPPLGAAFAGLDVAAASSTSPSSVFLGYGTFDVPLVTSTGSTAPRNWSLWFGGQMGLKGITTAANSAAGAVSAVSTAISATPDKVVQSFDFSMDLALQVKAWDVGAGTLDVGAPSDPAAVTTTHATLSVLAGAGMITPLSASQGQPQIFVATQQVLSTPTLVPSAPYAATCSSVINSCYVSLVPSDRTRFFSHWEVGARLKLYGTDYVHQQVRYPGIIDLTVGENDYVTGGAFYTAVMHLGGFFPIPMVDGFYVFGSVDMAVRARNVVSDPILFTAAPATVTSTSPGVYAIPVGQPNRDRYQIGFGWDIGHLISNINKTPAKP